MISIYSRPIIRRVSFLLLESIILCLGVNVSYCACYNTCIHEETWLCLRGFVQERRNTIQCTMYHQCVYFLKCILEPPISSFLHLEKYCILRYTIRGNWHQGILLIPYLLLT